MELDVDAAAASIDALIERRSASQEAATREEEAWKESARKHNARRRERNRDAWREFHLRHAESLERTAASLAAEHRAKAAELAASEGAA